MSYLPKRTTSFIDECFFVANNIWMGDTSQYPDLVKCIFFLFFGKVQHLDLLEGICVIIFLSSDLVYATIGTITCN